ncbi:hypothetical protein C457_14900 [Haloferax prahovense DSM 18310]|uniref:Uncharacterized protein n=1 Tax=Haloferax prahovense (strain DSM 18310 / JCM 13924 / TL6) TaxID=1227461 RepID=M0G3D2_HALPT|nr:hypothetical protein [Haloferax prahovense]ELZ66078.1 hypothetical protein C457_14900 [Haloferax prahovense DSM 18310]
MTLNKKEIEKLAREYHKVEGEHNYKLENRLLSSLPSKFENSSWGMNDMMDIMSWMRPALKNHFSQNSHSDVQNAVRRATKATDVSDKIEALNEIYGVRTKVASAILMYMDPDDFSVMTNPSLIGLRDNGYSVPAPSDNPSADEYAQYLDECRSIASQNNVSLRTLDRAMVVSSSD